MSRPSQAVAAGAEGHASRPTRTVVAEWLAVVAAVLLLVAHKPWALHTPQLWAEDGSVFLSDAELHGLRAWLQPYQGYLHTLPRLIVATTNAFVDPRWWPLCYNLGAFLATVGVLARMTSPRLQAPHKPAMILAFGLVIQTGEALFNITNAQWITAFFLVQQLLMAAPRTRLQLAGDVAVTLLAGLTGPFVIVILPFLAWHAWRQRDGRTWVVPAAAGVCAAIQGWFITHSTSVPPAPIPDHFNLLQYLGVLANRIVFWPLFGTTAASTVPGPIIALVGWSLLGFIAVRLLRSQPCQETALFLLAILLGLVAAISLRARPDGWYVTDLVNGDRYFFIPRVLFVWLLIWQLDSSSRWISRGTGALLVIGVVLELPSHRIPTPTNYHWERYCEPIRRGEPVAIPTLPEGWTLHYPGRSHRTP